MEQIDNALPRLPECLDQTVKLLLRRYCYPANLERTGPELRKPGGLFRHRQHVPEHDWPVENTPRANTHQGRGGLCQELVRRRQLTSAVDLIPCSCPTKSVAESANTNTYKETCKQAAWPLTEGALNHYSRNKLLLKLLQLVFHTVNDRSTWWNKLS